MEKPQNYDNTQELGEYTPINLGGHKLVIMQVEEKKANNGSEYIKVFFDTAKDDAQPEYYKNSFTQDTRDNKKWGGWTNIFITDRDGKTSKQFKTFCTSVERSNAGFKIQWGANFCTALKGKAIGGVFGEEEYINNAGEVKTAHKLFWFRSTEKIMDVEIPKKRELSDDDKASNSNVDADGFMVVPDGLEDTGLPFM